MDVLSLINNLEEQLEHAKNVPLSSKKMIDIDEFLDVIDNLKNSIPDEIKQSQLVLERETYILEDAKRNAGLIIKEAEETALRLVDEHEIVLAANTKAEEMLNSARGNAKEIRDGALMYATDVLRDLEQRVQQNLMTIQSNMKEFEI